MYPTQPTSIKKTDLCLHLQFSNRNSQFQITVVQEILAFVVVVAQGPCSLVESYKDKYGLHQPLRHLPSFPPLLWHTAFIYKSRVMKSSFPILIKFQIWKIQIFICCLGKTILTVLLNCKKGLFLGCTSANYAHAKQITIILTHLFFQKTVTKLCGITK